MAKSFAQSYGINYFEAFVLVAKLNSIRILIALTAIQVWEINQFDVKNAFLDGELEEKVDMNPLPGYSLTNKRNLACKLENALYPLKQSP